MSASFRLQKPPKSTSDQAPNSPPLEGEIKVSRGSSLQPPVQSRYEKMLFELEDIPRKLNILAAFFSWLLLAGYVVFPGTFTSLRNSTAVDNLGKAGRTAVRTFQNLPLLWVAGACCLCGTFGISYLFVEKYKNYIWIRDRIVTPGLLNSLAGLITTLINIYTVQHGFWSSTAIVTAVITGTFVVVMLALFLTYYKLIQVVRIEHDCGMGRT